MAIIKTIIGNQFNSEQINPTPQNTVIKDTIVIVLNGEIGNKVDKKSTFAGTSKSKSTSISISPSKSVKFNKLPNINVTIV